MSTSALHEIADAFAASGYLFNFEHVLLSAQAEGCSTVVLSAAHFHLLAAAIYNAAGGALVLATRGDTEALRARLVAGTATAEDQALAAEFVPHWHDGRAVTIDGDLVTVTNARYRGTWSGCTIVTLDYDATVELLH